MSKHGCKLASFSICCFFVQDLDFHTQTCHFHPSPQIAVLNGVVQKKVVALDSVGCIKLVLSQTGNSGHSAL